MPNFDVINPNGIRPPAGSNFTPPRKRRFRKLKWLLVVVILLTLGLWGVTRVFSRTNQIFTSKQNIFTRIGNLIISPDRPLIGEEDGAVNILLMGIGGEGHDGAHLADTMIVASIDLKSHEVVLTSIPRDFALVLPKVGYNKINAAYAYGYRDDPNTAGDAAIWAAQEVTGLTIPYYAVIDFQGFVKAVNDVGGVDVVIDNTFTDTTFPNDYPNDTKGYLSPVTFAKGPAHMDGRTALIFARSRHSENNNEGSDFARSERQKKIITALKERVLSLNLTDLATINNLLADFSDNFRTNLEPYEMKRLADLAKETASDAIYSFSLEPQTNLICSELVDANTGKHIVVPAKPAPETPTATETLATKPTAPAPDSAPAEPQVVPMYVIHPCVGKTLGDIHEFVRLAPILAKLRKEAASLELQNSVGKTGLANKLFGPLADFGVVIKYTTFQGKVPYEQTLLYDNSHNGKPQTLEYLKSNFRLNLSDVNYPASPADFVIIIGKDNL